MQAEFLLAESVRLLGLPDAGASAERLPSTQPSGE